MPKLSLHSVMNRIKRPRRLRASKAAAAAVAAMEAEAEAIAAVEAEAVVAVEAEAVVAVEAEAVAAVEAEAEAIAAVEAEAVVAGEADAVVAMEAGAGAGVELPASDATLAMAYPPGFHLFKEDNDRIRTCPRHVTVHGIYNDRSLPPPLQNKIDKVEVKNFEFDTALRGRLFRLIPQISDFDPEELMRREMIRHGPNLPFLTTTDAYANFALDLYERYRFAGLLDFIVETVIREDIGRRRDEVELPWIGVTVADLLRIGNSYPPIQAVNGQLNLVVIEMSGGRLFLYEITFCVNRDGLPGRRRRQAEDNIIGDVYGRLMSGMLYGLFTVLLKKSSGSAGNKVDVQKFFGCIGIFALSGFW